MPRLTAKKRPKSKTTVYDVAEHLRTPEEMATLMSTVRTLGRLKFQVQRLMPVISLRDPRIRL